MGESEAKQCENRPISVGLVAHVDAGKTTLSEAMLYSCGQVRQQGRVDHGDAFLDTDALERQRGITIFSKQAVLALRGRTVTLLDTPGHVDFSGEMERTLSVLDCAVVVISGTDGVQSHTRTVWELLARHHVPMLVFVNKMDLPGKGKAALLQELQALHPGCIDCTLAAEQLQEELALHSEAAMDAYLAMGTVPDAITAQMVWQRRVVPCWFGSALKLDGVDALLQGIADWVCPPPAPTEFGARVFKIARDPAGARLTYLKITGGALRVKEMLSGHSAEGDEWSEKVDAIRIYSGEKYKTTELAVAGTVCAVTGLAHTWPGQGLGFEADAQDTRLQPVLTYQVLPPDGCDAHTLLQCLQELAQEEPQLHVTWNEQNREIGVRLMGTVQQEVLQSLLHRRYGLDVTFGKGSIVYRETIAAPVEGAGHFEPLRHYAEVHLLLEPGQPDSGLVFASQCGDMLDVNWQRLVLTHLEEKQHVGVLTGSPITDMRITLTAGRAHPKHTEGGDFRQATYRALRQGLRSAQSVLLEPYYTFRLEVPSAQVGRAMADLQRMEAEFAPPQMAEDTAVLTGSGPAATLEDYGAQVVSYTKGTGSWQCTFSGYRPCHNTDEVVARIGYNCDADQENTADSVFCAHGAGYVVPWQEASAKMHVSSGLALNKPAPTAAPDDAPRRGAARAAAGSLEEDKELEALFVRTYGARKSGTPLLHRPKETQPAPLPSQQGPEYLLVDGYNVLYANETLSALAQTNLDAARRALIDCLCNYQGYRKNRVIVVFDAYKVPQGTGEVTREGGVYVVYTKEAETADMYIEKATYQLGKNCRVRVATSDRAEQLIIIGHDTLRMSAQLFWQEVEQTQKEIAAHIEAANRENDRNFRRG